MKIITKIALTSALMLPLLAAAQGPGQFVQPTSNPIGQLLNIVNTVASWMLGALIVLAGVFVIWAGYIYLTAAGDPGKVGTAKNLMIYAVVAVAVGLLAKVIVAVAQQLVT